MTYGRDPYPLPLANRTLPWVMQRERVSGGGCVVWEKEGGGGSGAKMLQKQKPLTFTHTLLWREEGTGSGSLCLRTPEKKKQKENKERQSGGEGKTERESVVDTGQRRIHWIEMCSNKSARKKRRRRANSDAR